MSKGRRKWYGSLHNTDLPQGRVQVEGQIRDAERRARPFTLPEHILRLAQAEYEHQFSGQDYERMQERGGLGILEVVALLADHVERLGGEPTMPRKGDQ